MVKLALAHYPITFFSSWENYEDHIENWVKNAGDANLLVFPEYGSMELVSLLPSELQRDLNAQILAMQKFLGAFQSLFERLAGAYKKIIVAPSYPVSEEGKVYNRAFVFGEHGLAGYQDKRFMTRFENEDWSIDPGAASYTVFEASWGSFGIQICYDAEFPVGSAILAENGALLILAPSCTETRRGATRVHIGARARALENQCFVGVSQTVGNAPWSAAVDINFGFCGVYSTPDLGLPEEGILSTSVPNTPGWHTEVLDFRLIEQVRTQGSVLNFNDQGKTGMQLKGTTVTVSKVRL